MYNADEVSDWIMREGLQAKLEGVILKTVVKDKFFDGSSGMHQVDHEEQLYQPIASAIYGPVNQAARILGLPLEYATSRGTLFGSNLVHRVVAFSMCSQLC